MDEKYKISSEIPEELNEEELENEKVEGLSNE